MLLTLPVVHKSCFSLSRRFDQPRFNLNSLCTQSIGPLVAKKLFPKKLWMPNNQATSDHNSGCYMPPYTSGCYMPSYTLTYRGWMINTPQDSLCGKHGYSE